LQDSSDKIGFLAVVLDNVFPVEDHSQSALAAIVDAEIPGSAPAVPAIGKAVVY
jgi:hypothetical protein